MYFQLRIAIDNLAYARFETQGGIIEAVIVTRYQLGERRAVGKVDIMAAGIGFQAVPFVAGAQQQVD